MVHSTFITLVIFDLLLLGHALVFTVVNYAEKRQEMGHGGEAGGGEEEAPFQLTGTGVAIPHALLIPAFCGQVGVMFGFDSVDSFCVDPKGKNSAAVLSTRADTKISLNFCENECFALGVLAGFRTFGVGRAEKRSALLAGALPLRLRSSVDYHGVGYRANSRRSHQIFGRRMDFGVGAFFCQRDLPHPTLLSLYQSSVHSGIDSEKKGEAKHIKFFSNLKHFQYFLIW